ncbi:zip homologous protein 2-like [Anthonomus grandis grandis]|uniref:zip homologous protein 2-like n=1 Tax=Anthonomus grandis grandis TaxID=2921223 RepID=UPI0021668081|nr:zip homologous protein 2-like [Anthonomus grandis grandis]
MTFVFCNSCSLPFGRIKFYLTECGHIFCEKCIRAVTRHKKCTMCQKGTRAMEISAKMDFQTQMYFYPFSSILDQSLKVYNFQMMHKRIYEESVMKKYNCAKKQCVHYHNILVKLQTEVEELKQLLKQHGHEIPSPKPPSGPLSSSTPLSQANITFNTFGNQSISNMSMVTPASVPGTAFRIKNPVVPSVPTPVHTPAASTSSSPSPLQRVPKGIMAPIHDPNKPRKFFNAFAHRALTRQPPLVRRTPGYGLTPANECPKE